MAALSVDVLSQILKKIENNDDLEIEKVETQPACSKGENSMSEVSRVRIHGKTKINGERIEYQKSLIIKQPIASNQLRMLFNMDSLFNNEIFVYKTVLPALRAHLSLTTLQIPKCIHAEDEIIILEDLTDTGYHMVSNKNRLSVDQCKLALQELAKFHASSIILKKHDSNSFSKLIDSLSEVFLAQKNYTFSNLYKQTLEAVTDLVRNESKINVDNVRKLERLHPVYEKIHQTIKCKDENAVLCHGDFWNANILFRKDFTRMKMIDFQAVLYASPAYDLSYLLYVNLSPVQLSQNIDYLLNIYCTTLVKLAADECIDVAEIYTPEYINNEMKRFKVFGFMISLIFIPFFSKDCPTEDFAIENILCETNLKNPFRESEDCRRKALEYTYDFIYNTTL